MWPIHLRIILYRSAKYPCQSVRKDLWQYHSSIYHEKHTNHHYCERKELQIPLKKLLFPRLFLFIVVFFLKQRPKLIKATTNPNSDSYIYISCSLKHRLQNTEMGSNSGSTKVQYLPHICSPYQSLCSNPLCHGSILRKTGVCLLCNLAYSRTKAQQLTLAYILEKKSLNKPTKKYF